MSDTNGRPTYVSRAMLKLESGEAVLWQQEVLDLMDYIVNTTADSYDVDHEEVMMEILNDLEALHEDEQ